MDNRRYYIYLVMVFGAGNELIWEIIARCKNSVEKAYKMLISENRVFRFNSGYERAIATTHIEQSEEIIKYCDNNGIKIITYESEEYPERLRDIYNPPCILFCKGNLSFIDEEVCITIVGTRHPSPYSIRLAKRISEELTKVGTVIVSGFALGIDSMAHWGALKNGGRTVAVLGCGIDVAYPKENAEIKEVIAKRGAVISEFFPGTPPNGKNFPIRNRILSGLSLGTLVIEASAQSGSLITAECALQQGRDVFCIPPADVFDKRYSGVIKLLRDGAIPTFSHIDIMYEYYDNYSYKLNAGNPYGEYSIEEKVVEKETAKVTEEKDNNNYIEIDESKLNEIQLKIVNELRGGSKLVDEIAVNTETEISEVLSELTELELLGIVKALAGRMYGI